MNVQIDEQTDGQSRQFGQNRKMLLIYHFNGDREVIEEKIFNKFLIVKKYKYKNSHSTLQSFMMPIHSKAVIFVAK